MLERAGGGKEKGEKKKKGNATREREQKTFLLDGSITNLTHARTRLSYQSSESGTRFMNFQGDEKKKKEGRKEKKPIPWAS